MPSKPAKSTQATAASGPPVFQIKITLKGSKPPIWRRLLLPGDIPLDCLHHVIQAAMGWYCCHLHQFMTGTGPTTRYFGEQTPDFSDFNDLEIEDEREFSLAGLAPAARKKLRYEYDYGDGWLHEILVEKLLPPDPAMRHPVCTAGENACPPEDCGGIYGYYDLLAAVKDPKHPEHKERLEWLGGSFDPERFELDAVNMTLKQRITC
ncbi:MAG: plasmid pRiA4b ORF-3 family protein [Verrucomicrobia bacterium]|nr:plasmid pRiA4b ORF-3 family protein [Verrucomicrobiota bacterium]